MKNNKFIKKKNINSDKNIYIKIVEDVKSIETENTALNDIEEVKTEIVESDIIEDLKKKKTSPKPSKKDDGE